MPARQASVPTALIQDLTSQATITAAGTTTETITGTTSNMTDLDLTTEYRVAGTGAGATSAYIQFDFRRSIRNIILNCKYDLGAGSAVVLQHSENGSDWTTLDSVQHATTASYNIFVARYIRLYATNNGAKSEVAVYEIAIMGRGT